ncbi:MAG: hypothetical protein OHK005_19040 [Candidatus Methylacidiphilales bacterium]
MPFFVRISICGRYARFSLVVKTFFSALQLFLNLFEQALSNSYPIYSWLVSSLQRRRCRNSGVFVPAYGELAETTSPPSIHVGLTLGDASRPLSHPHARRIPGLAFKGNLL